MKLSLGKKKMAMRTVYLIGIAVLIVAATSASVAFSGTLNQNQCNPPPATPSAAPESGYQYFVDYNMTNGAIVGVDIAPSCQLQGNAPIIGPSQAGKVATLNITASSYVSIMIPNGYVNAFYVNLQTKQLSVIPGVSIVDSLHV